MFPAVRSPTSLHATHGASALALTVAPLAAGTLPWTSAPTDLVSTGQAAACAVSTPSLSTKLLLQPLWLVVVGVLA